MPKTFTVVEVVRLIESVASERARNYEQDSRELESIRNDRAEHGYGIGSNRLAQRLYAKLQEIQKQSS